MSFDIYNPRVLIPGGKFEDFSSNRIPITITNKPSLVEGPYGKDVMDANGSSHSLVLQQKFDINNLSFFVCYWLRLDTDGSRGGFYQRKSTSPFHGFWLGKGTTGFVQAYVIDDAGNQAFASVAQKMGAWVHYGLGYDHLTKTTTLYADGIPVNAQTTAGMTNVFTLAEHGFPTLFSRPSGGFLNGAAFGFRFYDALPSSEDILRIMQLDSMGPPKLRRPQPFTDISTAPDPTDTTLVGAYLNVHTRGTADDSSGEENHATPTAVSFLADGGGGGYFNGSTSFINCGQDASLDLTGAHTILATYNSINVAPKLFIAKRGGSGANYQAYLAPEMRYYNGTSVSASGHTPVQNVINRYAWVHDGVTTLKFYVNGALVSTQTIAVGSVKAENLFIGKDNVGTFTHGNTWDVEIYSEAKSLDWIAADYAKRVPNNNLLLATY